MLSKEFDAIKKELHCFSDNECDCREEAAKSLLLFEKLQERLKSLIEKALRQKEESLAIEALILFAENIGCADDMRIAEKFLACMQDENLISTEAYTAFYDHTNLGRWQ